MLQWEDVLAAKNRLEGYIHHTPLEHSRQIDQIAQAEVQLKCEQWQKTGSFKARGAIHRLLTLTEEEKQRGVVTYSSGNHAQALCYGAQQFQIPAWVFMPTTARKAKVEACKGYNGHVVQVGQTGAQARPEALAFGKANGLTYIDPVEDDGIMAGQSTVGIEICASVQQLDAVYVPVGGGGLLSGVATAVKILSPQTKVIGVEPERLNFMGLSFHQGCRMQIEPQTSIADGLAGVMPGEKAFAHMMRWVDEMITVSEEEIMEAWILLMERAKLYVEPSAAASLAGLLSHRGFVGKKNVCVLSGGNIGVGEVAEILQMGKQNP